jgi:uncharacterized phiE125 gp8 family phage protein
MTAMPLIPVRTVAPSELPVSVVAAKAHLRIDHNDEDAVVEGLIRAAASYLDGNDGVLGKAIVNQTWQVDMSAFADPVRLPLTPVQSVTSITYFDALNATQTVPPANYALFADVLGSYVQPIGGAAWPAVYARADAIRITFVAGYGPAAAVPEAITQLILLLVGHWYENREAVVVGPSVAPLPMAVEALLAAKKSWVV